MTIATKTAFAAIVAASCGLPAASAVAQQAGTYAGTSADGQGVTLTVTTDTATGKLAVTGALIFFSAPCKGAVYTLNTGWGYGMTSDITARRASNTSNGTYFDIAFSVDFSADGQSATGKVTSISPTLYPETGVKPTKALICTSPKQAFSLTLQPAATAARAEKTPMFIAR